MRPSMVAAIVAGLAVIAYILQKRKMPPVPLVVSADNRYSIDDYIGAEEL